MERPEAVDAGSIILTGLVPGTVLDSIKMTTELHNNNVGGTTIPKEYTITNTSHIVLKLILGTAQLSNIWDGINKLDI